MITSEETNQILAELGFERNQPVIYQRTPTSPRVQTRILGANKDRSLDVFVEGKIRVATPDKLSLGDCMDCKHPLEEHDQMGNCNHPDGRRSTGLCGCGEL